MNHDIAGQIADYQEKKKALRFFDANCWIDFADTEKFHEIGTLDQLNDWLQRKKIVRAVVTHSESIRYEPFIGNDHLASIIKNYEHFYGSMVLTPDLLYNGMDLEAYILDKIRQKFVMARFFPKKFYHSLADFAMGKMLSCLEALRLPVMIWHSEASWEEIDSICRNYPDLPLIIEGNPTKLLYHNRNYITLLQTHGNLMIETHGLIVYDELDWLVARFGAERFIFGSYAPYLDPDVTQANLCLSRMSFEDQEKIASKNLDRLIGNIAIP